MPTSIRAAGAPGSISRGRGYRMVATAVAAALLSAAAPAALSSQTPDAPRAYDLTALTAETLVLRVDEGYVDHHGQGEPPSDDELFVAPFDGIAAQAPDRYTVTADADAAYAGGREPVSVARKTKPTEFASYCDAFGADPSGRFGASCLNSRPDRANEHLLYLRLPAPLADGVTYTLTTALPDVPTLTVTYDARGSRSEAVHVNQVGYVPDAGEKFGYVYHWLGDGGGLDLGDAPRGFALVDETSGAEAFTGAVAFRKPADNQEFAYVSQAPPSGNLIGVASWECDFSAFDAPGAYRLCVDGVGCSFPFAIGEGVYRAPFAATVEGLYQQRSGIALDAAYTSQPRPAPHRVGVTPGFAGRLVYSTVRAMDYENFDAPANQKDAIDAAVLGPLEAWGWYQDAGDWDSYYTHTRVPAHLLWLYEMGGAAWTDGQLRIPEAGNGLPDVLDEALWNVRFHQRLRAELVDEGYGSGGVGGGRVFGDLWGDDRGPDDALRGSWEDVDRRWVVSGEDPVMTYAYAGLAAHAAVLLARDGLTDPEGVDWAAEARSAYAWAEANTLPGDESSRQPVPFREVRLFAAANLFRLTGERAYETQASADFDAVVGGDPSPEKAFAFAAYRAAADERPAGTTPAVVAKVTARLLADGRFVLTRDRDRRAARWGGNYFQPVVVGQSTTPLIQAGILAHYFAPRHDPANVDVYRDALYSTADYFLGNNPLNIAWLTGIGGPDGPAERVPEEIFALDAWVLAGETPRPGITPYGPVSQQFNYFGVNGAFNIAWPLSSIYPADEDAWPMHELWFEQRQAPTTVEYTVHQNVAVAYFTYGYLAALSAGAPLPVTWTAVAAERVGEGGARVTWATAAETGNAGFAVERSRDGAAWEVVATAATAHTSADPSGSPREYAALDRTLGRAAAYYRVRQFDADGASSVSAVASVPAVDGPKPGRGRPSLAPNPATDRVRVSWGDADGFGESEGSRQQSETHAKRAVTLRDAYGRVVARGRLPSGGELPTGAVAPGRYAVEVAGVGTAVLVVQ